MLQELPTDQVLKDLIRASRIFVAIAANSLAGDDEPLSLQQYRALALLASREGQRPADLSKSLGVTPSTTTALCDRLVQKGMISRRGRGSDRRSIYLVVSARGHEQLEMISARRGELLGEIFLNSRHRRRPSLPRRSPPLLRLQGRPTSTSGRSGDLSRVARPQATGCSETSFER